MTEQTKKIENFKEWSKNANYINLTLTIDSLLVKELILDIINLSGLTRKLDLAEEALTCILANLYINHLSNKPTMIPGDRKIWHSWKKNKTAEWASLDRVNALLGAMLKMGYINKVDGVHTAQNNYIAKYWLKDNIPILDTTDKLDKSPVYIRDFIKSVVVRDKDGNSLNWEDLKCDKRKIKKMSTNITRYNKLLKQQDITFEISLAEIYKDKDNWFNTVENLQYYVNVNCIELCINGDRIKKIYKHTTDSNKYIILDTGYKKYILEEGSKNIKVDSNKEYSLYMVLSSYGNRKYSLVNDVSSFGDSENAHFLLSGTLNFTTQRRIFNRGTFDLGGRFYGGAWNNLSKVIRDKFRINGEPVERLDYDGIHLRLLYHKMIGEAFTDEAYVYSKLDDNIDRERMKLITLIIINAKNQREGVYAINKRFKKKGLFVSAQHTYKLIKQFKDYHKSISDYFFKDVGVVLQKIDSDIMYNVLTRLTKDNIPVMSVHDEVIFPAQNKNIVEKYMLEEYEKEVGFATTVK